jgi:hypothetical protein
MSSHNDWRAKLDELYAGLERQFREAAMRHPACSLYLYFKPATATDYGSFQIAPTKPDGFELVKAERINNIPFAHLSMVLRPIIGRLPLVAQNA